VVSCWLGAARTDLLFNTRYHLITLLIGTNRPDSRAGKLARLYATILSELGGEFQLLDLIALPLDFTTSALYHNAGQHAGFNALAGLLTTSDKVVIFVPEYNGSFPGVLKAFIDGLPYPGGLRGKKAALVGLSDGGQGAGPALSHLTDVLMYLGTTVLPQRVRLPFIGKDLTAGGTLNSPLSNQLLREQAAALLAF
jgi:chromate reductase, NAD(P)H dehydrogenase (quinone)